MNIKFINFKKNIDIEKINNSLKKQRFNELRQQKLNELKSYVDDLYQKYVEKYPEIEVKSFQTKAQEASMVINNPDIPLEQTPYISALVGNDKTKRNELAQAINAKVTYTAHLESYGIQMRDYINSLTDYETLENLTFDFKG